MRRISILVVVLVFVAVSAPWAGASTLFEASLSGLNSVPPNASSATGFGTVLPNDAQDTITANLNWSGPVRGKHSGTGLYHWNRHTPAFPGGKIRRYLGRAQDRTVPEPSSVLLGILGLTSIGGFARLRKA
ncbi:MAG: CHRD domain-containing protein [Armatimonadetes bacterium]|nr:CHRD domain-containing protein [Armatimonadota bacterium]